MGLSATSRVSWSHLPKAPWRKVPGPTYLLAYSIRTFASCIRLVSWDTPSPP